MFPGDYETPFKICVFIHTMFKLYVKIPMWVLIAIKAWAKDHNYLPGPSSKDISKSQLKLTYFY